MDTGTPKYARKVLIESHWFLKYKLRDDNSVQILGHWRDQPPEGMTWQEATQIAATFRLEEDGSRFVNRVWLNDGQPHPGTLELPKGSKVHVVANPQHVFSYGER